MLDVFSISLDRKSHVPLYKQLATSILNEIKDGKLSDNEKLPSRRTLSSLLQISATTVEMAYQMLIEADYLVPKKNSGFYVRSPEFISTNFSNLSWAEQKGVLYNFTYNGMDVSNIRTDIWIEMIRSIVYEGQDYFGHGAKQGELALRQTIARHLYMTRELACRSDRILIGCGIHYLMTELRKLFDPDTVFGIGNPSDYRMYDTLNKFNGKISYMDIGLDGMDIDGLYRSNIQILYVTPEHHPRTCYRMDLETRKSLLRWANEKEGRYIIEHPYDFYYTYEDSNFPSLFSLDTNERVIYMDSFERSLSPAFKMAYFILPKAILDLFRERLVLYNSLVSRFEQQVFVKFMDDGFYSKHIKEMRTLYRSKRDLLIHTLRSVEIGKHMTISGEFAGTHFLAAMQSAWSDEELREKAAHAGVRILSLKACLFRVSDRIPDKVFLFGFGGLSNADIVNVVHLLNEAWTDA